MVLMRGQPRRRAAHRADEPATGGAARPRPAARAQHRDRGAWRPWRKILQERAEHQGSLPCMTGTTLRAAIRTPCARSAWGRHDFYQKPIDDVDVLSMIVERAVRLTADRRPRAADAPFEPADRNRALAGIMTDAPEMLRMCRMLERVAPADRERPPARRESGHRQGAGRQGRCTSSARAAGKAVHRDQLRRDSRGPAGEASCSATSRGAFTGAVSRPRARVELAQGGTLMLGRDRRSALPLQVKLLALPAGARDRAGRRAPVDPGRPCGSSAPRTRTCRI